MKIEFCEEPNVPIPALLTQALRESIGGTSINIVRQKWPPFSIMLDGGTDVTQLATILETFGYQLQHINKETYAARKHPV